VIAGLLLGRVPPGVVIALVASVIEIGAGIWAGHHFTAQAYEAQIAQADAARAKAVADAASAAQTETARRVQAQQEIAQDAQHAAQAARFDAGRADAAAATLRVQLGAYLAGNRGAAVDPATVAAGQTAGDAARVLADLFSRADDFAGRMAAAADAARAAGAACERSYDALSK
jgi:hypothetical protein